MTERSDWMSLSADERDGRDKTVKSTKYRDEDWLRDRYHGDGLLMKEIAEICGCDISTINKWIGKHNIERKSPTESQGVEDTLYKDERWLWEKYYEEQMTIMEIASECDVSFRTVQASMERLGIPTRSRSEAQSIVMEDPERRRQQSEVAKEVFEPWGDYDKEVDQSWRHSGEWNLTSYEVRYRDDFTCQWCGDTPETVHAHHIIPVAEGGPKFDQNNLITLCPPCHHATHTKDGEVFFAC